MLTFTLAISCLTTSNLPWFMDLTFQVPSQTTGYCFCFGCIPSFFLELFLHWSPVAYWAPNDLGSSSFDILSFCPCIRWENCQLEHEREAYYSLLHQDILSDFWAVWISWWLWVLTLSQTFNVFPWSHLVHLMFHSFIYHLPCDTEETASDFILGGSKITADGDCSHEIKGHLLLERKVRTNLDSILKAQTLFCQKRSV